jgi:hypothetical protein
MEEQTFFEGPGTAITSTRILINGKTYATRNVGSVSVTTIPASRGVGIFIVAIGLICLFAKNWEWGIGLSVIGAAFIMIAKPTYKLMMMAGGGEVMALQTKDGPAVQKLHDAVAQAIAVR